MSDLVETIVTAYNATAALTALCANCVADLEADAERSPVLPYVVVSEIYNDREQEAFARTYREDSHVIRFEVFCSTRAATVALLDLIEDTFLTAALSPTRYTVYGPFVLNRRTSQVADRYRGKLDLRYLTERRG